MYVYVSGWTDANPFEYRCFSAASHASSRSLFKTFGPSKKKTAAPSYACRAAWECSSPNLPFSGCLHHGPAEVRADRLHATSNAATAAPLLPGARANKARAADAALGRIRNRSGNVGGRTHGSHRWLGLRLAGLPHSCARVCLDLGPRAPQEASAANSRFEHNSPSSDRRILRALQRQKPQRQSPCCYGSGSAWAKVWMQLNLHWSSLLAKSITVLMLQTTSACSISLLVASPGSCWSNRLRARQAHSPRSCAECHPGSMMSWNSWADFCCATL